MVETTEEYRNRINQLKTSIENEPYIKKMREDIAEGISKTGDRQADIEVRQDILEDDFVAVQQDASSASPSGAEVAVARAGFNTLDERLTTKEQEVTTQLAQIVVEVNNLMSQTDIQSVLNTANRIKFKQGIYDIDLGTGGTGLLVKSDKVLDFENGAVLKAKTSNLENYRILGLFDVENTVINNPQIIGERESHIGDSGEYGHGIQLVNTKGVTINKAEISNCWGDGIYIGGGNEGLTINNPICDNNRRQGISLISCRGLLISHPKLLNTNGTSPQSGIDIEPNSPEDYLEDIHIVNPYTENNEGWGIVIALGNLSNSGRIVDITIDNHRDEGSRMALGFGSVSGVLRGSININNNTGINNREQGIYGRNYSVNGPRIIINNPIIINPVRVPVLSDRFDSAIMFYREASDVSTNDIGNIHIHNPIIQCDDANIRTLIYIFDASGKTVKKISIIDPIELSLKYKNFAFYHNIESINISDKFNQLKKSITSDITIYNGDGYNVFDNKGALSGYNVHITKNLNIGWEMTFKIEVAQNLVLNFPSDEILTPLANVPGKYFSSNTKGSRLKIKKVSATEWHVVEQIGIWNYSA